MSARTRLVVALATSGLVLGALAGARLEHPWWAAALAPAPLLVAARCLPLALALPLVVTVGAGARALGALGVAGTTVSTAALSGLALAVACVADRSCTTRWPRLGALAFPLTVLALDLALGALDAPARTLPVGGDGLTGMLTRGLGAAAAPFSCATFAVALAALASVANGHRPDPLPGAVRERAARHVAVGATLAVAALVVVAGVLDGGASR